MWAVTLKKNIGKNLNKLPIKIQEQFKALMLELRATGPVQKGWANYSKIQGTKKCHHCHIKRGKPTYVVVWKELEHNKLEVTYLGTHEKANYKRLC